MEGPEEMSHDEPGGQLPVTAGVNALAELASVRARAEASEYAAALDHLSRAASRLCADGPLELRDATRSAIIQEIAHALGWSRHQAGTRLARAYRVRQQLPRCWRAFATGALDAARILVLGEAVERLRHQDSATAMDRAALDHAPGRTARELKSHLDELVARLEPEELEAAAARSLTERRVAIEDRGDGMSELWALIPTLSAGVIDQALTQAAKPRTRKAGDARLTGSAEGTTLAQARADVLTEALTGGRAPTAHDLSAAEWQRRANEQVSAGRPCLCHGLPTADAPFAEDGDPPLELCPDLPALPGDDAPGTRAGGHDVLSGDDPESTATGLAGVNVHIGVMIPATALTGDSMQPGTSWDRRWTVPAEQVRALTTSGGPAQVFWHRILIGTGDDVLTHEYAGRFAPDTLRQAIGFRDRSCSVAGCPVPAIGCDIDHRAPWPEGATRGDNTWALCRTHHRWKTLGVIEPVTLDDHDVGTDTHQAEPEDGKTAGDVSTDLPSWGFRLPGGSIVPSTRARRGSSPRSLPATTPRLRKLARAEVRRRRSVRAASRLRRIMSSR